LLLLFAMRVAVPIWAGRVSPVFDVAKRLLLIEIEQRRVGCRMEHDLSAGNRVGTLTRLGVEILICGAISLRLERSLCAAGIDVVSDTTGAVDEVINALIAGTLDDEGFAMPGCSRKRHRRRPRAWRQGAERRLHGLGSGH
jgi:predicted Fe-Mo cluster-binding NifX family protein